MSRKVSSLPDEEPAWLHRVRPGRDSEWDRHFRQGCIEHYRAWAQFHKAPWIDQVVAPGSVIEFNKYPVFRGRIKVEPPLGPNNAVILKRLGVMEECYSERWIMSKVAAELKMPLEEAIEKYGPEGEFLDSDNANLQETEQELIEFHGQNVPPRSQPPGYCKFHYWEEDPTGRVIREAGREAAQTVAGEEDPAHTVAYLAWNLSMKHYYPVEWLAYLGQVIFKPAGCLLNGDLEWFDDYESLGTIRVVNSTVSVAESFYSDPGNMEAGCGCPGCLRASECQGPVDWIMPTVSPEAFRTPGRDTTRLQNELEIYASLPTPCTWQKAGERLICTMSDVAAASTVLLKLPAAPPIEHVICTGGDEEEDDDNQGET